MQDAALAPVAVALSPLRVRSSTRLAEFLWGQESGVIFVYKRSTKVDFLT